MMFGLTNLGKEYIKMLNKFNIIVDVSHASEKTFWDIVNITEKPIAATHSNVFNLCNNSRNLKDNQIKAIANSGGIIGICFYNDFLSNNHKSNVKDVVKHIQYIKDLVGIDFVGLGSDFDGMEYEETADELKDITQINNLVKELESEKFSQEEIEKIVWRNWSNFLEKNLE